MTNGLDRECLGALLVEALRALWQNPDVQIGTVITAPAFGTQMLLATVLSLARDQMAEPFSSAHALVARAALETWGLFREEDQGELMKDDVAQRFMDRLGLKDGNWQRRPSSSNP